eukprot:TRINITY_DN1116_c0_g1_i1.p1 TRINITY_DN1116_c0_g1~~TRINITY_DN1116_c0_g1_i1.p1  ORF type:complete len:276 (+),score=56.71 TRINITY_DN1116_c0_g1_i1:39-830(+)
MKLLFLITTLLVAGLVSADENPSKALSGVTDLTPSNFAKKTKNGKFWLIEFYAPWCGWCKRLIPEMSKLGEIVGDHPKVQIGKIDASEDDAADLSDKYKVKGFPTIILLKPDGTFKRFSGKRIADSMLDFIKDEAGVTITVQVKPELSGKPGTGVVQVLTSQTFDSVMQDKNADVFVKFYAPWCGHCKSMAADWEALAKKYEGVNDIIIAEVDADQHRDVGTKQGVGSFPTIKFFSKTDKKGVEYKSARTTEAFKNFLDNKRK